MIKLLGKMVGVFHKTIELPHRDLSGAGATDGWWSLAFQIHWSGVRYRTSMAPTHRRRILVPAANVPSVVHREDRRHYTFSRGPRVGPVVVMMNPPQQGRYL